MKRRRILLVIVLIIAAGVWSSYYNSSFKFLFLNDAMDYAAIGRNVARGDGFVSSYLTPLGLACKGGLPHPDLWRAPFWPLVLGLFVKLLGATDQVVAIATGFFFVAGAGLVFLLARELFGELVAFGSALVFIFSAQNFLNSISGMTETFAVFMMLLVVYLAVAPWARNVWGDLLAGAALGLFYLTRYNALLFVPFFAVFLWYRRREDKRKEIPGPSLFVKSKGPGLWPVVRYLGAFFLVISPWLIRNYLLMGDPLFSLQKFEPAMFTATYPGYSMYMMLEKINVLDFLKTHPQEVWAKVAAGWNEFGQGFLNPGSTGVSPYLFWLFLISLLIPFHKKSGLHLNNRSGSFHGRSGFHQDRPGLPPALHPVEMRHKGVRPLLLACFIIQLFVLLLIHFIYRLFFIFMPFYIIFGVAALVWLLNRAADRLPVKRTGFVGLFTVLLMGVFIATNLPSRGPLKNKDMPIIGLRESVKAVADMSTREDLIISNDGHLLAWYGDRCAAKLPYRVGMIPEMEKLAPVKFIYLSSRISWNIPEADGSWGKMYWGKPKEVYGFKIARVFPDGSVIYRKD